MTLLLTLDDGSVQRKLADAVEFARAAVLEDAPEEQLGAHVGVTREDAVTASHLFEAQVPGYGGWRWSVTVALAGDDEPVTVSEVVLVPGPDALVAPAWVPWERRVRAGDLGVGDIFPTAADDPRLVPAYLQSDDPAVEEVAREVGLGRVHALSRIGRAEAASRWHAGEFGPRSDMARSAPDVCGTCGFFVPLAGSLRGVFGVCSNDIAPADGHVVDVEYGCGAHSEVEVEVTSSIPVAELVYDDSLLDFTPAPEVAASEVASEAPEVLETAAAEPETAIAESDVSPAEVEPEIAEPQALAEAATTPAEDPAPEAAEAQPEAALDVTGEVAKPVEVPEQEAAEVAEPQTAEVAGEEAAAPAEIDPVLAAAPEAAGPVVEDVPEPAEAEPSQAEVTDAVELPAAPEAPEAPAVAESPAEPAGAELPAAAEAPGESSAVAESSAEPAGADVPPAAESDSVELPAAPEAPAAAEPSAETAVAEVPLAAESDAADGDSGVPAEPEAPELPEAVQVEPAAAEPGPAEVTEADGVVTDSSDPSQPDEAQARIDDTPGR
ncbi:DUF3027 domain-containing protein [Amycolatopsis tolypomycina]|uniref:DUF3027 domain-containing protein n=1 Tax=Amycolatopsis tolypomycina TaxID=208445 RepID=UPI003F4BC2A7